MPQMPAMIVWLTSKQIDSASSQVSVVQPVENAASDSPQTFGV